MAEPPEQRPTDGEAARDPDATAGPPDDPTTADDPTTPLDPGASAVTGDAPGPVELVGGGEGPTVPVEPEETTRRRALRGIVQLTFRGVTIRVLGLAANVALARLLTPDDFGVVAIGFAVVVLGGFFTSGGLGAALIQQRDEPTREQLRAVFGTQVAAALVLAAIVAAIGSQLGTIGLVTAVMVLAAPIDTIRIPAAIVAQRELDFRPMVRSGIGEMLVYNAAAVGLVLLGLGVWGIALATLLRAATGSAVLARYASVGVVRPTLRLDLVRPLLRFGVTLQAEGAIELTKMTAVTAGTGAIAGVATLGQWSLTTRLLQPMQLLFEALAGVAFPALAKLVREEGDVGPTLAKSLRITAVLCGLGTVGVIGSAPALVPSVFGPQWRPAVDVVPGAVLGLLIAVPFRVVVGSYLNALHRPGLVAGAGALQAVVWLAVGLSLLPVIGLVALGIGYVVGSLLEIVALSRSVRRWTAVRPVRSVGPSLLAVVLGGVAGWVVARALGETLPATAVSLAAASLVYLSVLGLVAREMLSEAWGTLRSVRGGTSSATPTSAGTAV